MLDSPAGKHLTARVLMLENILGKLFAMVLEQNHLSKEQADFLLDQLVEASKRDVVIETTDPALSDQMAAEVEERTRLFAESLKRILKIRRG